MTSWFDGRSTLLSVKASVIKLSRLYSIYLKGIRTRYVQVKSIPIFAMSLLFYFHLRRILIFVVLCHHEYVPCSRVITRIHGKRGVETRLKMGRRMLSLAGYPQDE